MISLVLGGMSSGKSAFAQRLAEVHPSVVVLATGWASDGEMEQRIAAHRQSRPGHWQVLEERVELRAAVPAGAPCVLLESVDSWLANLLDGEIGKPISAEGCLAELAEIGRGRDLFLVSAEVGQCLVPLTPAGRTFADLLGRLNQLIAGEADEVIQVVAGLGLTLKSNLERARG